MKERIAYALQSLPEEIAVHGTTQSRGKSIISAGLTERINYFNVVKTPSGKEPKQALRDVLLELAYPISQGLKAARNDGAFDYSFDNYVKDRIPGLMIFLPPKKYETNEVGQYTSKPIPAANIIGDITLEGFPPNATFTTIITTHLDLVLGAAIQVYDLLKEKGLINSSEPQQPTQE